VSSAHGNYFLPKTKDIPVRPAIKNSTPEKPEDVPTKLETALPFA